MSIAWWRFETTDGRTGYVSFDQEAMIETGLYWDDGAPVTEGISYTVTDTNATPPEWSA